MSEPILQMKQISKEFSGVRVLDQVDFSIYEGRVMALLGENGAGKSTLMKILTGVYTRTSGEILMNGQPVFFLDTGASQKCGIAFIHQELNLIRDLSIAENIFLGREPLTKAGSIDWNRMNAEARKWMDQLGLSENPKELLGNLSVGKQQMVEIAKALSIKAKIIIMDEPTGALTLKETERLFQVIRDLKQQGHSIVYISHRLTEIFEICDDVTILRDGKLVAEQPIQSLNQDLLIEMMVGRKLEEQYPWIPPLTGNLVLEAKQISNQFGTDNSFSVREGEILGVAGLMGSGRTELMRTIYGIYRMDQGELFLHGKKVTIRSSQDAIREGIAYVSEDRKANGIHVGLNVKENITMAALKSFSGFGYLNHKKEEEASAQYIRSMSIKTTGLRQQLRHLSGGNQQKVSISKNLLTKPKVLILDEPTRGVDVGAKREIYELINQFKKEGMSIIMISSEIPEILGMSDRVMVMHEGRITGEMNRNQASQERIMTLAVGKVTEVAQ